MTKDIKGLISMRKYYFLKKRFLKELQSISKNKKWSHQNKITQWDRQKIR